MLKIHRVRAGGHAYYLQGAEVGTELEEPGRWAGPAAPSLGLAGGVEPEVFDLVMAGRHPATDQTLRQARRVGGVEAFDLTFCAPKSVSLLHALAPREVADAAGAGHHRAVAEAADYLSRQGIGVRRTSGGECRFLPSTGMVAGEFRHRVSRSLDPHLHTHLVTANIARGPDDRWSSVDGRRLYAHLRSAGTLYHSRLRLELATRMGAAWEIRPTGLGDVVGVDPGVRRLFSRRSVAIEEFEELRPTGHRGAAMATRPDKVFDVSPEDLVTSWRQRADDAGFDLGELSRVVGRGRLSPSDPPPGRPDPQRLMTTLDTPRRSGQLLARRDLVAAVAAASVTGASEAVVEAVVDRIATSVSADTTLTRAHEPRWRAGQVAALILRRGEDLVQVPDRAMAPERPSPAAGHHLETGRAIGRHWGRGDGIGLTR